MFSSLANFFGGIGSAVQSGAVNAWNSVYNTVAPYLSNQQAQVGSAIPKASPQASPNVPAGPMAPSGASGSFMVNQPFRTSAPTATKSGSSANAGSSWSPTSNTSSLSYDSGGMSGPSSFMFSQPATPTSITSGSMASAPAINLTPSAPTIPKSYQGTATMGNVALGADPGTGLFGTSSATKVNPDGSINTTYNEEGKAEKAFNDYITSLKAPPSAAESYERAIKDTGLLEARQRKQNTQNRINAITSKMNTDLLQLRGTAGKEGVVEAVYGGQQAAITREATIALLPLQAQLAVDQGDLEMAEENTNMLFKIYADDAKASANFYNDGVKAAWEFFNDEEKKVAAERLWQKNHNADMVKAEAEHQRDLATEAFKSGNMPGYRAITGIRMPSNVNSPTFAEDFATYKQDLASTVERVGVAAGAGSTKQEDLVAYASQYSDTGKLPSPAELRLSGLSVGQVTSYAKQMPKPNGAIVSTNTGTKSSALSAAQESGVAALNEIVNSTLPNLREVFPKIATGVIGGITGKIWTSQDRQNYLTWRQEFLSKLLVARSGAAVTEQEYERYSKLLPGEFNQSFFLGSDGSKKLNALSTSMKNSLDNVLNTNQLSVYGYSKADVNGQKRTVGEVLDIGGQKYRVLPDGTLTDII